MKIRDPLLKLCSVNNQDCILYSSRGSLGESLFSPHLSSALKRFSFNFGWGSQAKSQNSRKVKLMVIILVGVCQRRPKGVFNCHIWNHGGYLKIFTNANTSSKSSTGMLSHKELVVVMLLKVTTCKSTLYNLHFLQMHYCWFKRVVNCSMSL